MENQYSLLADVLSKFHTSPEWIQALWLLAIPSVIIGTLYFLKEALVAFVRHDPPHAGELVYSIYRTVDDKLLVYRHGEGIEKTDPESVLLLPARSENPGGFGGFG